MVASMSMRPWTASSRVIRPSSRWRQSSKSLAHAVERSSALAQFSTMTPERTFVPPMSAASMAFAGAGSPPARWPPRQHAWHGSRHRRRCLRSSATCRGAKTA
jgi:hypothetical protein